jgi:putative copper resistance protein D
VNIDILAATVRAASFILTLQATGAATYLLLFRHHLSASRGAVRQLTHISGVLGLLLVGAHYAMEAGRMGGGLTSVADWELQELVARTPLAQAAFVRLAGLGLLVWATRGEVFAKRPAIAGLVATFGSFAFVGHTASHTFSPWLAPLLMLHVGVAAFWFGGLPPLLMALRRESLSISSRLVDGYSAWAIWLVPGLFVAGLLLLVVLTGFRSGVLALPYGRILAFKIVAFLVLIGFAAYNRARLAPRLRLGQAAAARFLVTSVSCELALIAVVIAATAVLTALYSPQQP